MSSTHLENRSPLLDQDELKQREDFEVEREPVEEPSLPARPTEHQPVKSAVLRGLGDDTRMRYSAERMGGEFAKSRREQRGAIEITDRQHGGALYIDPQWGPIAGKLIQRSDGTSYFQSLKASVEAHPDQIGAGTIILSGARIGPEVRIGAETFVGVGAVLRGNITIGSFCTIESGAKLNGGPYANQTLELENRVTIGAESRIGPSSRESSFQCVLGEDAKMGARSSILGSSVIGRSVTIESDCALEWIQVLDHITIGSHSSIYGPALTEATLRRNLPARSICH